MKKTKRDIEIILTAFLKEILLSSEQFGHFGTKMVCCPLHFECTLRFFINFTQKKGTKRYMKLFLVVF